MNRTLIVSFVIAIALSATIIMAAEPVNRQISLQGKLTDASGKPLDGTYSVTFDLYETATGGSSVWTEVQSVTVAKGVFSTRLGKTDSFTGITFNKPYYVEITVNDDPAMTPRFVLTANPYTLSTPVIPTTFDAGAIISGVFNAARIPALSQLSGTLLATQVPALDASKIATGTLALARIPLLGPAQIGGGSITTDHLQGLIVTTAKIANLAVTTDKLAANAVTAAKITDNTITAAKMSTLSNGGVYSIRELTCGTGGTTVNVGPTTHMLMCSPLGSGYVAYCSFNDGNNYLVACKNFDGTDNNSGKVAFMTIVKK